MLKKGLLGFSIVSQILLVIFMGVYMFTHRAQKEIIHDLFIQPSSSLQGGEPSAFSVPFTSFLKAKGVVVPSSGYIKVSNPLIGKVKDVFVSLGDRVNQDTPLFKLCDDEAQLEVKEKKACLDQSIARLNFMKKGPSEFALLSKQKEVEEVEIKKHGQEREAEIFQTLLSKTAISTIEHDEKQLFLQITEKELERVKAQYDELKAGISPEEELIYINDVEEKKASLKLSRLKLEDTAVKAPTSGTVLSIDVLEGEYLNDRGIKGITIGKTTPSMICVSVDEKEAYKICLGQKLRAIAVHPANPSIYFVLDYLCHHPKLSVYTNGERKLELFFTFHKGDFPIYLEQSLDVFVETFKTADLSFVHYQYH